jgi:hypothetical protein
VFLVPLESEPLEQLASQASQVPRVYLAQPALLAPQALLAHQAQPALLEQLALQAPQETQVSQVPQAFPERLDLEPQAQLVQLA